MPGRIVSLFFGLMTLTASGFAQWFLPGAEITNASVLEGMNYYRAIHGLVPLHEDPRLTLAASDRMADMEEQGYFAHESPDGKSPFIWVRKRGYDFAMAGENLANGFETANVLVASWMESPGHRANILSPQYFDVGIAIINGMPTGRAVGKSVVVIFAREKVQLIR